MKASAKKILGAPGALPLHLQVSEMLTREIQAGILLDGERLPPEREMAKHLGVSIGTLRKALADLVEKEMLERVQGSGNYIRHKPDPKSISAFFHLVLITGGGLPTARTHSVERVRKPAGFPQFGSSPEAFRILRFRDLNQQEVALEEIWLDGRYTEQLRTEDLPDSLYQFYKDSLGVWITRAEDKVGVNRLPEWTPAEFTSANAHTWGYIERLSWDQHGETAEFSRTWFNADRARFVARWR